MPQHSHKFAILLILITLSSYSEAGFGVARENLPNGILKLHPGESTWYSIWIQNPTENNMYVSVGMKGGENAVTITKAKDIYLVPAKTDNTQIRLNISIPKDTSTNKIYNVSILVGQAVGTGKGVTLSGAIGFAMKVQVIGETEKSTFISRMNLSEQTIPCLSIGDCPNDHKCEKWVCIPATTTTIPQTVASSSSKWMIGVAILIVLAIVAFIKREEILYRLHT